jgi:ketosteroid isomerase-like protein
MSNVERWIEKFIEFGAQPNPSRYVALFDPEGTVFDSGMERPLKATEVATHMEGVLKLMPDFHFTISRWRERENTVFVDAQNAATIAGRKLLWDAVYCVTLQGDRVMRGRRYYDRAPLFARVSPTLPSLPAYEPIVDQEIERNIGTGPSASGLTPAEFLTQYAQLWQAPLPRRFADFYHSRGRMLNPGMHRPLCRSEIPGYYTFLLSTIPDLRMEQQAWAGDQQALYVEWRAKGSFVGKPFQLNVVDRFEFIDGRVIYGQAYFDTVALLRLTDPSIDAVHFAPSAGVTGKEDQ